MDNIPACVYCRRILTKANRTYKLSREGGGVACPQCALLAKYGLHFVGLSDGDEKTRWYLRGDYHEANSQDDEEIFTVTVNK
jgi:hypothetical protein